MEAPTIRLCVVVPCYNEEERLDVATFEQYLATHPEVSLCFVNDGSSDKTQAIIEAIAKRFANALAVDLPQNAGKAAAVRQGYLSLLDDDFTHIGFWDADLATPLEEIDAFLEVISRHPEIEVVLGSRVLRLGTRIERKWYRHLLGRLFATVASCVLHIPVYDTQCGAKIISRNLYREIFSEPLQAKWIFDVELLYRILQTEYFANHPDCIYELPLHDWQDVAGSKLKATDFAKAPWELLKLHLHYGKINQPWTLKKSTRGSLPKSKNHWWIRTRFLYLDKAIATAGNNRPDPLEVAEFGCGTAQNLWYLRDQSPHRARIGRLTGIDPNLPAEWLSDPRHEGIELLTSTPHDEATFDLILGMDVLEHVDDDVAILSEWLPVLAPNGVVLLTVPAFQCLWSGHDEFLEHRRRYTRTQLDKVARQCGLQRVKSHYAFSYLVPPAYILRKVVRPKKIESDLKVPNPLVNTAMKVVGKAEAAIGGCQFFGTSVVGIYRKPE